LSYPALDSRGHNRFTVAD